MRKLFVVIASLVALATAGTAGAGLFCEDDFELVTICVPTYAFDPETFDLTPTGQETVEVPAFVAAILIQEIGASEGPCEEPVQAAEPEPVIPAREILCLNGVALDLEVGTVVEGAVVARFYEGVGATCDDLGGTFTGKYVGATGDEVAPEHADLSFVTAYPLFA